MRTIGQRHQYIHLGAQIDEIACLPVACVPLEAPFGVDVHRREEANARVNVAAVET